MHARTRRLIVASLAGTGAIMLGLAASASAANTPTYRDCSFSGGLDPDFVRLMGAKPNAKGMLVAPRRRKQVTVTASESPNAFDQLNRASIQVAVYRSGELKRTVSGAGKGSVTLSVPLPGPRAGRTYRLGWIARFDNGIHTCPSSSTPQNPGPRPFVIKVRRR